MAEEHTNHLSPDEIPFEVVKPTGENEDYIPSETNMDLPIENEEVTTGEKKEIETGGEIITTTEINDNNALSESKAIELLKELSEKFDKKIAVDNHKNELFDKMYAELNSYKTDIYSKMLKPIIMDIIMYIDDTNKILRDIDKENPEKIFRILKDVPDDLLEILERNGVEAFHEDTDIFNAKTQRVLKAIPTEDPEMDDKIESRVRQGYKWDDKVIKPEMIQCYKYSQNK